MAYRRSSRKTRRASSGRRRVSRSFNARSSRRSTGSRRRVMRNGGARTVRLVIETQPTTQAIRTPDGFAVPAPVPARNPKF